MANREVHLEMLLGRCVLDATGKSIGRIEEVIAEKQGDEWVVREYLVGSGALLSRLSALDLGRALFGSLKSKGNGYRVPWDKLDLTDAEKPSLHCSTRELEPIADRPKKRSRSAKD